MNENVTEEEKQTLPKIAFEEIPTPNADAQTITELQREDGIITGYKLSDGQVLSIEDAVELARQGGIRDVGIAMNEGTEYLKSLPDGDDNNNLSHLPTTES